MKKLLMFLVVVLTFSVSACGSGEKNIAPDYADEVAFEKALNSGENVTGKTVVFIAASLHPGSKLGYNIWSGEHLNFITSSNPGIKEGQQVTAKITKAENILGSWILSYELLSKKDADPAATKAPKRSVVLRDVDYVLYDYGENSQIFFAVTMENPNADYVIVYPKINIVCKSKDGGILDTEEYSLSYIAAGDSLPYAGEFICDGGKPEKIEITVSNSESDYELQTAKYVSHSAFEISNVSKMANGVSGEVKNTSGSETDIVVIVIYYKDGKIVGRSTEYLFDLAAGQSKAFKCSKPYMMDEYDDVKTVAMEW